MKKIIFFIFYVLCIFNTTQLIAKTIRGAVLPFTIHDGQVMILLSQERASTQWWDDCGGSIESQDQYNPENTAKREFGEETKYVFAKYWQGRGDLKGLQEHSISGYIDTSNEYIESHKPYDSLKNGCKRYVTDNNLATTTRFVLFVDYIDENIFTNASSNGFSGTGEKIAYKWFPFDKIKKTINYGQNIITIAGVQYPICTHLITDLKEMNNKDNFFEELSSVTSTPVNLLSLSRNLGKLSNDLSSLNQQLTALTKKELPKTIDDAKSIDFICNGVEVTVVPEGNLLAMPVEAIVNAAHPTLMKNPGGVAGAIWNAAGSEQLNDWIDNNLRNKNLLPIPLGQARISPSFDLQKNGIKHIIHAVGPACNSGEPIDKLYDTYKNSLIIALENKITTIAFPPISTGIFGCDKKKCAQFTVQAIYENAHKNNITDIWLPIWDIDYYNAVVAELEKYQK